MNFSKIARAVASSLIALSLNTQAGTQATVTYQTRPMMSIYYADPGEKIYIDKETTSLYEISEAYKTGVESAFQYWADLLGPEAKNDLTGPVPVTVLTDDRNNAGAGSMTTINDTQYLGVNTFSDVIYGKTVSSAGRKDQSFIYIGKYIGANASGLDTQYGFYIDSSSALPQNEAAADFVSVLRHELGHALGITTQKPDLCNSDENNDDSPLGFWVTDNSESIPKKTFIKVSALNETFLENENCIEDDEGDPLWREWKAINDSTGYYEYYEINGLETNAFAHGLYDSNGVAAFSDAKSIASKLVITPNMFTALNAANSNTLKSSDYFILDPEGSAYFSGENVQKVLVPAGDNGTLSSIWEIKHDETLIAYGIPINGWECEGALKDGYQNTPELAHFNIETLMSHENYRNYTTFTEIELAALQDIGYNFDRKAYFGYSIYSDGGTFTNKTGYSKRNATGDGWTSDPSTVAYGVGLHLYGSQNIVKQKGDINTVGVGAIGVRVDGTKNQLTIAKNTQVASNGENGIGVLFSAGSDHTLAVKGTVTATAPTGNALQFDYGSNMLGATEYRGSWIRYCRSVDSDGNFTTGTNGSLSGSADLQNLNGPLLETVTIKGTLQGGNNAIYIAKNAYVKNIKIKAGAHIQGNITSDWMHFGTDYDAGEGLCIQYNSTSTPYSEAIEKYGLYTTLHFNNEGMEYSGNITGTDNIAVKVKKDLTYAGTAVVRSWNVPSGTLTLSNAIIGVSEDFDGGNLTGSNSALLIPIAVAMHGDATATTNTVQGLNVTVYGTRDERDAAHSQVFHPTNGLYQSLQGDVSKNQTTVTMAEGRVVGETTTSDGITLHEKENVRNRRSIDSLSPVATTARIEINDIRKRLGEVRSMTAPKTAWARYDGAKLKGETATTRFNKIQCGFDGAFNPAWRAGLAFSYTDANVRATDVRNDLGVFSLAAYGIYQQDNGFFTDLVGRLAFNHNRLAVDSDRVSLDTSTAALSAEAGWRFEGNRGVFIEPQLEASYSVTDGARYTIGNASYKLSSSDSLLGRAGFAAGASLGPNGIAYVRSSLVHEFLGDSTLSASSGTQSRRIVSKGKDTWFEYGLGLNYWVNQRTYVYADLERTAGAKTDTQYRVSLGIRHAF